MKLLVIAMLALAPMTSFAETYYGDTLQSDLTTINVLEASMEKCEEGYKKALATLTSRKKVIIDSGECRKMETIKKGLNHYGVIRFHKYL